VNHYLLEDYKALGTTWYIEVFGDFDPEHLMRARSDITHEILGFEEKYSRFKSDSLLNKLNRDNQVPYDTDLCNMLLQGEQWRAITGGVFDIAIKTRLEQRGYGTESGPIVVHPPTSSFDSRVSSTGTHILWHSTQAIDLGGIGKGYLIDTLAGILKMRHAMPYFIINGGGDMYATSDHGIPIEVVLEHPIDVGTYIGKITLHDQSLCASSSYKRTWIKGGVKYNHFIDTRTNKMVQAASFVVGQTACESDVLATVLAISSDTPECIPPIIHGRDIEYLTLNSYGEIFSTPIFAHALKSAV
jgi:thiamine biosynthesis lipoprotein